MNRIRPRLSGRIHGILPERRSGIRFGLRWGLVALALLTVSGSVLRSAVAEERPNILWIIAEDMGPELGCYGTPQVWTPHLDRLAQRGMRFTHAFTTAPVCSASRSAFMTGMYQTTIGAHNHRSHRDDGYRLPEGVKVLTDRLRDAGYFTANIRHLTTNEQERFFRGTGKTDWNFEYIDRPFDSDRWVDLKEHQPFYAQINFSETHRGRDWDNSHRHIEKVADPDKVKLPPYYPDHPLVRRDWAQYLNAVMALDRKVGRVLQQLEQDGLAENTVVIFFSDHGRAMMRGKQWCYESGLHIPLIIHWPANIPAPKQYQPGAISDQLVSAIDLTATTLSIAGGKKPDGMQGRIIWGDEADSPRKYVFSARDRCDETVFRIRTARDHRYRYIRNFLPERPFLQLNRYKEFMYPSIRLMRQLHTEGKLTAVQEILMAPRRSAEELYDLQNDPYEIHNLVDSPEHQDILGKMRGQMERWIEDSGDQGRYPEPVEVVEFWERRMKQVYDAKLKRRAQQESRKSND